MKVVVLGDGAHWIWNIAERHFPRAIQILDWYHASENIWTAASAIWGEADRERNRWAQCQLDVLWEGGVEQVLVELQQQLSSGEALEAAVSYYSEQRGKNVWGKTWSVRRRRELAAQTQQPRPSIAA